MKRFWEKAKIILAILFSTLFLTFLALVSIQSVAKIFLTLGGGAIGGVLLFVVAVFLVWWVIANL